MTSPPYSKLKRWIVCRCGWTFYSQAKTVTCPACNSPICKNWKPVEDVR